MDSANPAKNSTLEGKHEAGRIPGKRAKTGMEGNIFSQRIQNRH